jgi:hypothetical protein
MSLTQRCHENPSPFFRSVDTFRLILSAVPLDIYDPGHANNDYLRKKRLVMACHGLRPFYGVFAGPMIMGPRYTVLGFRFIPSGSAEESVKQFIHTVAVCQWQMDLQGG